MFLLDQLDLDYDDYDDYDNYDDYDDYDNYDDCDVMVDWGNHLAFQACSKLFFWRKHCHVFEFYLYTTWFSPSPPPDVFGVLEVGLLVVATGDTGILYVWIVFDHDLTSIPVAWNDALEVSILMGGLSLW